MKTVWTQGLEGDAKQDIVSAFKAGTLIRERLSKMLEAKRSTAMKARTNIDDYESPSWAFKQADVVGYSRAIQEIINLLEDKS